MLYWFCCCSKEGEYTMLDNSKETKYVMLFFAVICFILILMMINDFKVIDCCYFILVSGFAASYYLLVRD